MVGEALPVKDEQSVTPDGHSLRQLIDGVVVRHQAPVEDERGEICEIYNPAWGVLDAPIVYVYQTSIRPGRAKGWVVHMDQDDRLFISRGTIRFGLYDDRPESTTYKMLNVFTISDRNRALIVIPRRVYHGLQNVGDTEAVFINMPTQPYNHANPDKYRLPLKNDLIPFAFDDDIGW